VETGDPGAQASDATGEFVPRCDRVTRQGERAVDEVEVGTAHSGHLRSDDHLAVQRLRHRLLDQLDTTATVDDDGGHELGHGIPLVDRATPTVATRPSGASRLHPTVKRALLTTSPPLRPTDGPTELAGRCGEGYVGQVDERGAYRSETGSRATAAMSFS
jgi:hypothetical protein